MKREYRYDRATVTPVSSGDGFLRARVSIARPGVFPYFYTDGDIRLEAKLPEEILSELTIESAKGAPVTDGHPPFTDGRGLVTPANWNKYVKGALGDTIGIQDNHLTANETIFDAGLIAELKAGKKIEVSIGFEADIDPTPGQLDGSRYDCVQRNIRINHVAHVDKGRAGETVRAHLDSALSDGISVAVMKDTTQQENGMKDTHQKQDDNAILDGMKRFFAMFAKHDDAGPAPEGDPKPADKTADGAGDPQKDAGSDKEKEITILKAQIEALQALVTEKTKLLEEAMAPATMDSAINERLSLVDMARSVLPDLKHDGLKNRDIKLKVIEKLLPFGAEVKTDSIADVTVDARFDAAAALAREKAAIRTDQGSAVSHLDEAQIEKKRLGRLNLHEAQGGQK